MVTGEGSLDASSLAGKVVGEVLSRTHAGAACAVIAGVVDVDARQRLPSR